MFENAQLQNKLENLENVFIGSSGRRPTVPNGVGGVQNGYGPGTGNHPQLGGGQEVGMQQDYKIQNL